MEVGLVGFPLAGKTTIFNAITGATAQTKSFGSQPGKFNLAEVRVPDERLNQLAAIFKPKKITPVSLLVKDITLETDPSGRIKSEALVPLRNLDAIVLVIRAFENESVSGTHSGANPLADFKQLIDSFIFNDYEICERRLQRLKKEWKLASREATILTELSSILANGRLVGCDTLESHDKKLLSGFCLLSIKPILVLANLGEKSLPVSELQGLCQKLGIPFNSLRGDIESEIAQLPVTEQEAFLKDLGVNEPAVNRFVQGIYQSLKLISFLTAGEDEVRAWSIQEGTLAVNAAGKIHSDLEKGFIRAEVVFWQDLVAAGSFAEAKRRGLLRLEGKEYPVKDGDVLTIRFNV